jgi:hypothetical protein
MNATVVRTHFGRSGTVVPSTRLGAYGAPAIVVLPGVNVTGSEYPSLYDATSDIAADMLSAVAPPTAAQRELFTYMSNATCRPVLGHKHRLRIAESDSLESAFAHTHLFAAEDTVFGLLWAGIESETNERDEDDDAPTESESERGLVELAETIGAVEAEIMPREVLSGNLVRDVLSLTGFTAAELAHVVGRTERSVRQWIADGKAPVAVEPILRQLRTIALRLVGGLGPRGVRRWLTAGSPSPADRIATGGAEQVLAETERLLDSPAT